MSHSNALLLVLAAILFAAKYGSVRGDATDIVYGDDNVEVLLNPYSSGDDEIDLQLLDNTGKHPSLLYTFTNDCVPQGSFCRYPYGPYYTCCENTGCFCNRLGFCTCKTYDASENKNEDPKESLATINPVPE